MDLNDLKPKTDDIVVTLLHPATGEVLLNEDKEKTPMTITVMSPNSKEYKSILHTQTNKRLKQMQGKRKRDITAEEIEESGLELAVAVTKDWNITLGGSKPKFGAAAVKDIYTSYGWINKQVNEAVEDSEDFT